MGMLAYNVFVCARKSPFTSIRMAHYLPSLELPYGLGVPIQDVPLQDLSKVLMVSANHGDDCADITY